MSDIREYDALVVVTPKDFERLLPQCRRLIEYLPVRKLIYIGSNEVGELIKSNNLGDNVGFINENNIIPFSDVHEIIADEMKDVLKGEELPRGITGWYYQQFLKMQYAQICEDDYYMVWDGDTVPCKAFSMFADNGKPYLDLKTEFHEEYFDTLTKLFPGMFKCIEKSFIAEHMLIKKDIMLSMIADIEANEALAGMKFYEKIIHAVGVNKMQDSSFSEFETYGTYVAFNYPDVYRLRDWHSFRYAGEFFDINKIDDADYEWLSRDFYALSFEKGHFVREDHKNLFDNKDYQQKLSARQMLEIAQQEFGEGSYQEIWEDDSVEKSSDNTIKGEDDVFSEPTIIVIVSYNGQYFMEKNIESIRNTVPEGTYSIVVVDNASTDGTREWLEEQEDIVLIANDENVGFSKACNQAVKVITECGFGEYDIFLLNNDTRLCDNSLYWLKKTLHSSEDIGATGAISNYAGNNQEVPVEFNTPSEYVEYGNRNNVDKENATEDRVRLSGFAMLIRGGLWQMVGGMDEDFSPGYFEDDDLSMKISKLGYRLVLCNNSFIYHAGSQSFAKRDDIEQLLLDHYQLFIDKYGFYILNHVYPDKDVVAKLPFGIDDEVNVLQAGSGLGADLKYIRSIYLNSNVFGIEKDIAMFDIAKHTIPVFNSVEAMSETISGKVFNVLWIKDDISKYTQNEKEMLAAVCTDDCIVIKNKPQDAGNDTNTVVFENIKLVIWDLDQTFWTGILSEGNIALCSKNIELIKKLTDAGIINSVSSKNDEVAVNTELSKYGLDNYFVFNNINWEEKGAQIKEKLEDMHLRPENVLFIDDEIRNLKEAEYHNPGIMVATPEIIDALIAYADVIAKNDLEHKRLISYKNIESRRKAENEYSDKNQFLYDSNIKVSIETDAINEIERIYELINRTNQLNFTKVRDDIETLRSLLSDEKVDKGYIRVSDKYGDYGIAGFYCMDSENNKLRHFLFSCRIMGMGIPEYVYEKIGYPDLSVVNPVATDLFKNKKVDWINNNISVENKNDGCVRNNNKIKILLKGPCDLSSIEPYLIGGDVTTEFNFVNDQGFITTGQNHTMHIVEGDTLTREEIESIVSEVPFIVEEDFATSLFEKEYDVIALSMLTDCHAGLYKNKKTGAYINFGSCNFDLTDPKNMRGYIDGTIVNHLYPFTEEVINKFASEWEFVGTTDPMELLANLDYIYENVPGAPDIVLILGSEIDYEGESAEFANHAERHKEINQLLRAFAEDHDRIRIIDTTDYIHSQDDFEDSINHFSRNVYYDMATELVKCINDKVGEIASRKATSHAKGNEKRKCLVLLGEGDVRYCVEEYLSDKGIEYIDYNLLCDKEEFCDSVHILCSTDVNIENVTGVVVNLVDYVELIYGLHTQYWTLKSNWTNNLDRTEMCMTGMSYFRDVFASNSLQGVANLTNGSQDLYYDYLQLKRFCELKNGNVSRVIMGLAPYSLRYDETLSKRQIAQGRPIPYIHDYGDLHNMNQYTDIGCNLLKIRELIEKTVGLEICSRIYEKCYRKEQLGIDNLAVFNSEQVDDVYLYEIEGKYNKPYVETLTANKQILNDYIDFCAKNDMKLLVFIPPFTKWHNEHWRMEYKDELIEVLLGYKDKYNFDVLDLSEECWDDIYFRDYCHLNKYGAEKVCKILNDWIDDGNSGDCVDIDTYNLLYEITQKYEKNLNGYALISEKVYQEHQSRSIVGAENSIIEMYGLMQAFQSDLEKKYLDINYAKLVHTDDSVNNPFGGRGVVYTVITGEYDDLKIPSYIDEKLDYICFTNNENLKSDFWDIQIVTNFENLDNIRLARKTKILCREYLAGYDYSIYVDGKLQIVGDLRQLITRYSKGRGMLVFPHHMRDGIGEELDELIRLEKDNPQLMKKQVLEYLDEGYGMRAGMVDTACLIRNHHDDVLYKAMELWWKEVKNKSRRDQLSFGYSCWKSRYEFDVCNELLVNNEYIKPYEHNG